METAMQPITNDDTPEMVIFYKDISADDIVQGIVSTGRYCRGVHPTVGKILHSLSWILDA